MSPEISERSFEQQAIECGLLQHGPDAPWRHNRRAPLCLAAELF